MDRTHTAGVPVPRSDHTPTRQPTTHQRVRPAQDEPVRDRAWLRLLERAVGGWAPTLRGSLVLVALYLCAAVLMVIALGFGGLLMATGVTLLLAWLNSAGRLPRA